MSAVLVILHPFLSFGGGAEGVAMAAIADLAGAGHRLRIFTAEPAAQASAALLAREPGLEAAVRARQIAFVDTATGSLFGGLQRISRRRPPVLLGYALLLRELRLRQSLWRDADGVFSTVGEFSLTTGRRQICYVHFPMMPAIAIDASRLGGRLAQRQTLRRAYTGFSRLISGFRHLPEGTLVLTNSHWTAGEIALRLPGIQAEVLYPPVSAFPLSSAKDPDSGAGSALDGPPAGLRVMTLGRLVPYKGQDMILRALGAASCAAGKRSHAVFVGRGSDDDVAALQAMAGPDATVEVVRNASPVCIGEIIARSDLGISAFAHEHFGMACAEMQASGLPVLVPDGGGQVEIPPDRRFIFADEAGLQDILAQLMVDPAALGRLRAALPGTSDKFSRGKFRAGLLSQIEAHIGVANDRASNGTGR